MKCASWIAGARKTYDRKKANAPISPRDSIMVALPADEAEESGEDGAPGTGTLNCSLQSVLKRGREEAIRHAHDSTKPKGARGPKKKTVRVETTTISTGSPSVANYSAADVSGAQSSSGTSTVHKTVTTETTIHEHDTTLDLEDHEDQDPAVSLDSGENGLIPIILPNTAD